MHRAYSSTDSVALERAFFAAAILAFTTSSTESFRRYLRNDSVEDVVKARIAAAKKARSKATESVEE